MTKQNRKSYHQLCRLLESLVGYRPDVMLTLRERGRGGRHHLIHLDHFDAGDKMALHREFSSSNNVSYTLYAANYDPLTVSVL